MFTLNILRYSLSLARLKYWSYTLEKNKTKQTATAVESAKVNRIQIDTTIAFFLVQKCFLWGQEARSLLVNGEFWSGTLA